MVVFPNAKINLGLHVLYRRNDGFHELESLFYPVAWCDVLEVVPNHNGRLPLFVNTGLTIDGIAEDNLCVKAYKMLQDEYKLPSVHIHLHKIIPFGAGLGGGSSDAASTLVVLNNMFSLHLSEQVLVNYAAALGSDCPFFILNKPAVATGRGEILKKLRIDLSKYFILLVKPAISIATAMAYGGVKPQRPAVSLENVLCESVENWKHALKNDFEEHLFVQFPELYDIKTQLYNAGALYASLSGSGSAVYGLFSTDIKIPDTFKNYVVWKGNML